MRQGIVIGGLVPTVPLLQIGDDLMRKEVRSLADRSLNSRTSPSPSVGVRECNKKGNRPNGGNGFNIAGKKSPKGPEYILGSGQAGMAYINDLRTVSRIA